jgi:hypothetical protein
MPNFIKRGGSAIAGKTLSDLIEPSIERVKSGMKGFVVKVKNITHLPAPQKAGGEAPGTQERVQPRSQCR